MKCNQSRIWTRVAVSISCDDKHYTTGTSFVGNLLGTYKLNVFTSLGLLQLCIIFFAFCLLICLFYRSKYSNFSFQFFFQSNFFEYWFPYCIHLYTWSNQQVTVTQHMCWLFKAFKELYSCLIVLPFWEKIQLAKVNGKIKILFHCYSPLLKKTNIRALSLLFAINKITQ